jgi:hypothetical protein
MIVNWIFMASPYRGLGLPENIAQARVLRSHVFKKARLKREVELKFTAVSADAVSAFSVPTRE